MTKVAVIFADGCEEVEALTQIDVFRRLGIQADMVGLDSTDVMSAHQVALKMDKVADDSLLDYDAVIFPGGMGGAKRLKESSKMKNIMLKRQAAGKWDCAMCAAPTALAAYGVLDDADYTVYPGMDDQTQADAKNGRFHEDITVVDNDKHVITSRGPATALAFAYKIAETLGVDTADLKKGMLYDYLKKNIQFS